MVVDNNTIVQNVSGQYEGCAIDLAALKGKASYKSKIRVKLHNENSPVKRFVMFGRREDLLARNTWTNFTNWEDLYRARDSSGNVLTLGKEIILASSLQVNGNMA